MEIDHPCTVANDSQPECTYESILAAHKELEQIKAQQRSGDRHDCVVIPLEFLEDLPIVQSDSPVCLVSGNPYVDIAGYRYIMTQEFFNRVMKDFSIHRSMPLTVERDSL